MSHLNFDMVSERVFLSDILFFGPDVCGSASPDLKKIGNRVVFPFSFPTSNLWGFLWFEGIVHLIPVWDLIAGLALKLASVEIVAFPWLLSSSSSLILLFFCVLHFYCFFFNGRSILFCSGSISQTQWEELCLLGIRYADWHVRSGTACLHRWWVSCCPKQKWSRICYEAGYLEKKRIILSCSLLDYLIYWTKPRLYSGLDCMNLLQNHFQRLYSQAVQTWTSSALSICAWWYYLKASFGTRLHSLLLSIMVKRLSSWQKWLSCYRPRIFIMFAPPSWQRSSLCWWGFGYGHARGKASAVCL